MSDAHRTAMRKYALARRERGESQVTLWLDADARATLKKLALEYGSQDMAVKMLLLAAE